MEQIHHARHSTEIYDGVDHGSIHSATSLRGATRSSFMHRFTNRESKGTLLNLLEPTTPRALKSREQLPQVSCRKGRLLARDLQWYHLARMARPLQYLHPGRFTRSDGLLSLKSS